MKGSGIVDRYEQLDKLIADHDGIVQTSQVVAEGISKPVFYDYIKEKKLEQVAHGVYASADAWIDTLYLIHLRSKQAVFSHETALFLHDLTDREPAPYSITVKTGYNPNRLKADGVQVYTVKPELHGVGCTTAQTSFGHTVPVYDMERTICDLIRSRKGIEIQTLVSGSKWWALSPILKHHSILTLAMSLYQMRKVEKLAYRSVGLNHQIFSLILLNQQFQRNGMQS
jgi:hypothetical protein